MQILGLIPARGGSKGIPRKNIAPVAGKPLLAYTSEAAFASRLSRTVLSTDDGEIADVGRRLGLEIPFLRPPELAQDCSPAIDVIRHALEFLAVHEGYAPDAVMLLQPTSPLRRAEHIDAAITFLETTGADTVVSVVPVPHQFNPLSVMSLSDGRLSPFLNGPQITRRQEKPLVYARNGPAILLTLRSVLEEGKLYGDDSRPLVMHHSDSLDVDGPEDLDYLAYRILMMRQAA